jgi:hypothetical protein
VAGDLDGDWIFGCQSFDTLASDHAQHKNDEQRDHGDTEGGTHSPTRSAVCFFIFLKDRKRMASDNACLRARTTESGDHEDKNYENNPKNDPIQPFNVAALWGGCLQDVVASWIKWHSLRQPM